MMPSRKGILSKTANLDSGFLTDEQCNTIVRIYARLRIYRRQLDPWAPNYFLTRHRLDDHLGHTHRHYTIGHAHTNDRFISQRSGHLPCRSDVIWCVSGGCCSSGDPAERSRLGEYHARPICSRLTSRVLRCMLFNYVQD